MSDVRETLRTALLTLGYSVYDSIKPEAQTLPCIVYQLVSTVPMNAHTARLLNQYRFQVSVWGETKSTVVTLSDSVVSLLDVSFTPFKLGYLINEFDENLEDSNLKRVILEFYIFN